MSQETVVENPVIAEQGKSLYPELIADTGINVDPAQTLNIPEIGADNDSAGRLMENFEAPDEYVTGIPSMVIRTGEKDEHRDIYVLDVRHQPVVGQDRQGNAIRRIGYDSKSDSNMNATGDFILVSRSDDESLQIRALYPGASWGVDSKNGLGDDSNFPIGANSENICTISLDDKGTLTVGNDSPDKSTTVYRPESVDALALAQPVVDAQNEQTGEFLDRQHAKELLSYSDVLTDREAEQAVAYTETAPNGQKYIESLLDLDNEVGIGAVIETAKTLREACLNQLAQLGIKPSKYSESISWAMWDLAKQKYLAEHPEESTPEYTVGNPFDHNDTAAKILDQIVDRHLGWEYQQAYSEGRLHSVNPDAIDVIKHGQRNSTGQLRSVQLARLGHLVKS